MKYQFVSRVHFIYFFSVRLLSVLRGHSFFLPATTANDLRLRRTFYTRSYPLHYFCILFLEKEPVFPFLMLSAKKRELLVPFFITRSLTGDWTRDLPHSKQALLTLGYRGGGPWLEIELASTGGPGFTPPL